MNVRVIIPLLILLGSCGQRMSQEEKNINQFVKAASHTMTIADSVSCDAIRSSIPTVNGRERYLYVFRADCSSCILQAFRCYNACKYVFPDKEMLFLSMVNDTDIFSYYYEKQYKEPPVILKPISGLQYKEGLYMIQRDGQIMYYSWK